MKLSKLILTILCFIIFGIQKINAIDWNANASDYEYDMGVHASILINNNAVSSYGEYILAAFFQDECRGLAEIYSFEGKSYYELRIYSNNANAEESISFRCIEKSTGKELKINQTLLFEDGKQIGLLSSLYEIKGFWEVTNVSIDKQDLILKVPESATLSASVFPENAFNKKVIWSSNNESIATVDQTGKVTAVKAGTAVITVTTEDGGFSASCNVIILQPATGVALNKTTLTLNTPQTETLIATVNPADASNKKVSWESNNESVATVDQTGKVTAVKAGTAAITVTTEDGGFSASCNVTILQPATRVTLNKTTLTLNTTQTETLTATVNPADASNKKVSWESDNESIATVDQTGKVTAVKAGTAVITVTTEDGGFSASCNVTILQPATGVTLNKTTLTLNTTQTETLTATVNPADASNKKVSWESDNESVATVDQTGKVTAVKAGTAVITVTTEDGGFSASCNVTILQPATGVALNKTTLTLNTPQTETLIATVLPADAFNKNVKWSSSNEEIAFVDNNGLITALQTGSAIIKVTTEEGNFTASCNLTVIPFPTSISLVKTKLNLKVTEEEALEVLIEPKTAQYKLIWSSIDEMIASVDQNGKVIALKAGIVIIKVQTEDELLSAQCEVTVIQPVMDLLLNKSEIQLKKGESDVLVASVLPDDASDKTVNWESSDETIVTVDQQGKVIAINKGTAIITVTTKDSELTATCEIEVIDGNGLTVFREESIKVYLSEIKDIYSIKNVPNGEMINVIDLNGNIVKVFRSTGDYIQSLSLNDLITGIYFIQIRTDKENFTKKIIKRP